MRVSKLTLAFAAYIIISASFMQQVWGFWKLVFGKNVLILSFVILCLWVTFLILRKSVARGFNIIKIVLLSVVCILGFLFAWKQPYLPEKAHILEYGFLAWLCMRDFFKKNKNMFKNILSALIFVLIIGSLDEGFQKILPWRVFELRDIVTNVLSGIFGVAVFILQ